MNERTEALKARTKRFALDVLGLVTALPHTDEARVIGRQVLRSATGVASNYRAACRARSRAEFAARIGIALEEADESSLWLELLLEGGIARTTDAVRLLGESDQLTAIFAKSRITTLQALDRLPQDAGRPSRLRDRGS
ncbi:MAG: four helix bundle protein [Vicinamibacterales bacterium]